MSNARKREVFELNAKEAGFELGKSIRGKGTEVWSLPETVVDVSKYWVSRDVMEKEIKRAIEKYGKDNLFVGYLYYENTKYESNGHGYEYYDVDWVLENLYRIDSVKLYTKPKLLGYISISHYTVDYDGQCEFVRDLREMFGDTEVADVDYIDDVTALDRDNEVIHGDPYVIEAHAKYFDGRIYEYNEYALEEFWSNLEDPFEDIDPDEKIVVWHRKGKDWYVAPRAYENDYEVWYWNPVEQDLEQEYFTLIEEERAERLVEEALKILEDLKREVEIKSLIYNRAGLCEYCYENDKMFNLNILAKEYDNLWDFVYELPVDWNSNASPEYIVDDAYEKFLQSKLDEKLRLFGKYKHLYLLKKIAEDHGVEFGYDDEFGTYYLRFKNEKYHFYLRDLYNGSPKRFFNILFNSLLRRLTEKMKKRLVYRKAKEVFVGIEDSIQAGNCKVGTQEFIKQAGIDPDKIGGVRGNVLLELARPQDIKYVERAILQALKRQRNKGDEND